MGWGGILQLPTPRSSYSSIDLRTSPSPVEGGCRLATTATLVPRKPGTQMPPPAGESNPAGGEIPSIRPKGRGAWLAPIGQPGPRTQDIDTGAGTRTWLASDRQQVRKGARGADGVVGLWGQLPRGVSGPLQAASEGSLQGALAPRPGITSLGSSPQSPTGIRRYSCPGGSRRTRSHMTGIHVLAAAVLDRSSVVRVWGSGGWIAAGKFERSCGFQDSPLSPARIGFGRRGRACEKPCFPTISLGRFRVRVVRLRHGALSLFLNLSPLGFGYGWGLAKSGSASARCDESLGWRQERRTHFPLRRRFALAW